MKPARIIILTVAVVAAGLAGLLAMRLSGTSAPQIVDSVIEKQPTENVIVSAANLPIGSRLNEETLRWLAWPQNGLVEGFITQTARPKAIAELDGAVVRLPLCEGEADRG